MSSTKQKGFVVISSVVIFSSVLLLVTLSTATMFRGEGKNILHHEEKARSLALTEACAETALQRIVDTTQYNGNEVVYVGTDSCTIDPVVKAGKKRTVYVHGIIGDSTTRIKIEIQSVDIMNLDFFDEVASF